MHQAYCHMIFLYQGRVDLKEVDIEYCPTEEMVADYFIKPLQYNLFWKLCNQIMGLDVSSPYHSSHRSVLGKHEMDELVTGGHVNKSLMEELCDTYPVSTNGMNKEMQ